MPMGRYLCQLCWSIVHYGERHPCFFYKNDDEVYTVPPPNEPEEVEGKHEETEETPTGNLNDNKGSPFAVAEQSYIEGSNETTSLPIENNKQISVMPASRRKRIHLSLMPSKFLRVAKNGHSNSKSVSSTNTERVGIEDAAKKSKNPRKTESASALVPLIANGSSSEMAPNIAAFGSVSDTAVASESGSSGIQMQSHKIAKEEPFVCDLCGKVFSKKSHLEQHERAHTGEKPFVCSTCGKRFAQQGNLRRHRLIHTGEKSFPCDICGRRFAQKTDLERHFLTHSGEKPFKCKYCDECFAQQSSCNKHQKKKHGGT